MRYLIKTEHEDDLEDIISDQDLRVLHRYTHVPYTSIETELAYQELTTRYPDYQITQDKDYDTQDPAGDHEERPYNDQ